MVASMVVERAVRMEAKSVEKRVVLMAEWKVETTADETVAM